MTRSLRSAVQTESTERWLKRHGFQANPFAEQDAEREQARLASYFVDTPYYQDILGDVTQPRSIVIYAGRGCGKSAHRIMTFLACHPQTPQSTILGVNYTDFGRFTERLRRGSAYALLQDHLSNILRQTVETFVHLLLEDTTTTLQLPDERLGLLKWFWEEYGITIVDPGHYFEILRKIEPELFTQIEWTTFRQGWTARRLTPLLQSEPCWQSIKVQRLARLVDEPLEPLFDPEQLSAAMLFRQLVEVIQSTGIQAIYILVDRVEETELFAADTSVVADMLAPLLGELALIEVAGAAFKFFLPREVAHLLAMRPQIRTDRILFYELRWEDSALRELLHQRLISFSDGRIIDLGQLCEPDLATTIETELIFRALQTPRMLLRLAEALILAHCQQAGEALYLTRADWQAACRGYEQNAQLTPLLYPPLIIRPAEQKVVIGERSVRLTDTPFALLNALAEQSGQVIPQRQLLKIAGSADALRKAVERLRKEIEPNPKAPVYLVTVRGKGLRLDHVVEVDFVN
jgi:hypothetical protein